MSCRVLIAITLMLGAGCTSPEAEDGTTERPNIILVMADDMGWGQTGYYDHPVLETPQLDAMAANGLRFDRFYAGASNCSPTRATVMTGRSNDRTGVFDHGFPLRLQERTIAQTLRDAGYRTAHFGKWHLNGLRGPGVPILSADTHNPGAFGFETWLSVTNFFDVDPILSRQGEFEEFEGDSSEIVVGEALQYLGARGEEDAPFFVVIWYGSPHDPFRALDGDKASFSDLEEASQNHYAELAAMDRSLGALRQGLRDLGVAENTLLWFNSDNGGLPKVTPTSVGELRGFKNSMYEGGLRVPGVVEWPARIESGRVTEYPAGTIDIFPTLVEVAEAPSSPLPGDGVSLTRLFDEDLGERERPMGFLHRGRAVVIDNDYKILKLDLEADEYELYNLKQDPSESTDLTDSEPAVAERMQAALEAFSASVEASRQGLDYPEGAVNPGQPERRFWMTDPAYEPYLEEWKERPEYAPRFE